MRRGALLLIGLLLALSGCTGSRSDCDDTSTKSRASCPGPIPEPTEDVKQPSPPPPDRKPTTQVDLIHSITVNGQPVEGSSIEVLPGPTEVVIQFTVPMSRSSVEYHLRSLPAGSSIEWTAEDRLTLHVPAGNPFGLSLTDAFTGDGQFVQSEQRTLYVSRLNPKRLRLYEPATLLAGGPALTEANILMPDYAGLAISPDRWQAIIYAGDPWVPPSAPFIVDLMTGERTPLTGAPKDPLFCWAGWGPDSTPLMADSDGLWQVESGHLTRWSRFAERGCFLSAQSSDGRHLATWSPLRLIDLVTGAAVTVEGRFDPMGQDGAVNPHWSPESDQVALGNAAQSGIFGTPIETVIVGLDGQVVRRIPDWWPVTWLPDGDLLVYRFTAPDVMEQARLTREGQPSPRQAPPRGQFSPDGRWVIPWTNPTRQLIEVATGRSVDLPGIAYAKWQPDSTLLLVER